MRRSRSRSNGSRMAALGRSNACAPVATRCSHAAWRGSSYRIGIDVGGTFTDLVLRARDGTLVLDKHPDDAARPVRRRPRRPRAARGARGARRWPSCSRAPTLIVHGTTTADNTMIEMSGAVTGLVTSDGHRDEIEIRRGYKEDIWDPALPPPPPICPRRRRYGVPERLDFEGNVVVPLDEEAVRARCRRMRQQGVESLAVVLLFSFVNPTHERRVREIAAEELPGVDGVAVARGDAGGAGVRAHQHDAGERLRRAEDRALPVAARRTGCATAGFRGELLIMQSNGGVMPGGYVAQKAVAVHGLGADGRRDRRRRRRRGGRHPRLHLRRHGRHQLRRLPGARRRARGEGRAGTGTIAT